jgi:hypothetical protein
MTGGDRHDTGKPALIVDAVAAATPWYPDADQEIRN